LLSFSTLYGPFMNTTHFFKSTLLSLSCVLAGMALLTACGGSDDAQAAPASKPVKTSNNLLTRSDTQATLYIFDNDPVNGGKSNCNDKCAQIWPPFFVTNNDQPQDDLSIVTRDDGKKQWALKGRPLYGFEKDTKPGDTLGDGIGGVWHIIRP
jgi:predicted lipoprotein with Yx(FWY)xxD motif